VTVTNKDIGSKIPSPCQNDCNGHLTDDGICTGLTGKGCYRTVQECEEWGRVSDWRRVEILDNCEDRKMDEYRLTWFDTSSICENHKIYTGSRQDCIAKFKNDNPDVPLSRVVVDKITRGYKL